MSDLVERSYDDLYRKFLSIEADLELFDIRVDGVPVWERIRRPLWERIPESDRKSESDSTHVERTVPFRSRIRDIVTAVGPKNPFFKPPQNILVWGHNRRQLQIDGTYWDLYCDPLYDALDLEYLHLEIPHQGHHYTPAKTDRLAYMDLVRFGGALQRRLGRGAPNLDTHVEQRLRRAENTFRDAFDVSLDIRGRVRRTLAMRRTTKPLYGTLLDWHDPSLVLVVVSYGKETFIEACKERSIPVVELQHGVITRYHAGYSYPGDRRKETFPDKLLTFGRYWNETVDYPEGATSEAVGYPFLEREYERHMPAPDRDAVVFVSQHNHVGRPLSQLAVDVRGHVDPKMDVVYKLHPEEYQSWEARYPWLADSGVTVVGQDGPSIYELFSRALALVGVFSTALFEGLKFGLPVYVLREPGVGYVADLLETRAAKIIDSADELATELSGTQPLSVDADRFFEPDPLSNIEATLCRYVE